MRKQVRRLSAVFDDYNTNVFPPRGDSELAALHQDKQQQLWGHMYSS